MTLLALADWRSWAVMRRHARVYLRTWYIGMMPPAMEPVVAMLAFGLGLGGFIGTLIWHGQTLPYLTYLAPGLCAYTALNAPFFHALWGAYVRMYYQKLYDGLLATQVELPHVVAGEILWGGTMGTMFVGAVVTVILGLDACGVLHLPHPLMLPLVLPLVFVMGCAMAAFALTFTAVLPSIDHMNLPAFLLAIPLSLVSSTYFPVPEGHAVVGVLLAINPVHHLAESARALAILGAPDVHVVWTLVSSGVLLAVTMPLATLLLRRRLLGG
jgi:lipooligosaccharide transport system permease protein